MAESEAGEEQRGEEGSGLQTVIQMKHTTLRISKQRMLEPLSRQPPRLPQLCTLRYSGWRKQDPRPR